MFDTVALLCVNNLICKAIENKFKVLGNESIGSRPTKYGRSEDYLLLTKRNEIDDYDKTSLKITLNRGNGYVRIEGSLRKWYFGKYSFQDFKNSKQFKKAISVLANSLAINTTDIMPMDLYRLDFGKNYRFGKDFAFNLFTNNDVKGRNGNVTYYGKRTGIALEYQQYKLIIYDKLIEMAKSSNFKGAKILSKQMSLVRVEIQLKTKSSIEKKLINIHNLYDVCNNWNALERFWKKFFLDIEFENCRNEILLNPPQIKSTKDITNWVKVVGIYTIGYNRIKAYADYSKDISAFQKYRYFKNVRLLQSNFNCKNSFEVNEFKDKINGS